MSYDIVTHINKKSNAMNKAALRLEFYMKLSSTS